LGMNIGKGIVGGSKKAFMYRKGLGGEELKVTIEQSQGLGGVLRIAQEGSALWQPDIIRKKKILKWVVAIGHDKWDFHFAKNRRRRRVNRAGGA